MPAPGGKDKHAKDTHAKEVIERNIAKTWFLTTLATIVVSAILIVLSWLVLKGLRPGVAGSTFLWAVLFGWFFTFFVQAKRSFQRSLARCSAAAPTTSSPEPDS
jgi:hypothetical protein